MTDERVERLWMAKRRDDIRRELAGLRVEVREECAREVEAVVPITRLREWIENVRTKFSIRKGAPAADYWTGYSAALADLSALLDDVECASNPNNEGTR